ncbi:hypothetical protein VTK26DRAFT_2415 [Humicola hyalothermophila]
MCAGYLMLAAPYSGARPNRSSGISKGCIARCNRLFGSRCNRSFLLNSRLVTSCGTIRHRFTACHSITVTARVVESEIDDGRIRSETVLRQTGTRVPRDAWFVYSIGKLLVGMAHKRWQKKGQRR